MRRALMVLVLVAAVCAGVGLSLNYHVVTTSRGTVFVKKTTPTFTNTFVDTRQWGWLDLWKNQDVTIALIRTGHGDALPQVERFNQAVEAGVRTLEEFDARFGVSDKARAVGERLRQFESQHQVVEKAQDAVKRGTERAKEALERLRER